MIITASVLSYVGDPDLSAYGATKGGLRAMCRALAVACGPDNIRVNTVCPGDVETPGLNDYFDFQPDPAAARREVVGKYPMGRFAAPETWAMPSRSSPPTMPPTSPARTSWSTAGSWPRSTDLR